MEWWSGGVVEWWSGGVVEWWSGGARLPKDLSTIAKGFGFRRSFVYDADSRAEPGPGCATTLDPMSCVRESGSIQHANTRRLRHSRNGTSRVRLGACIGVTKQRAPEPELALRKR